VVRDEDPKIDQAKAQKMAIMILGHERNNLRTQAKSDSEMVQIIIKVIGDVLDRRY
jgi:hypothetical protein